MQSWVATAACIFSSRIWARETSKKEAGAMQTPNSQHLYRAAHQALQFLTPHLFKSLTEYKIHTRLR